MTPILTPERVCKEIRSIRARRPLIHCITNIVTVNDCANALLAIGASPTMAHHRDETAEITQACDALVLNLGATEDLEALYRAACRASELDHPIVLDPVGCGGSSVRRAFFRKLIRDCRLTVIRGNYSEIRALALDAATVTGVDAADSGDSIEALAAGLARRCGAVVIASGVADVVTDGEHTLLLENGDARMSTITGSGCMSSCMLGASVTERSADGVHARCGEDLLLGAASLCAAVGIAGELAAERTRAEMGGSMTFRLHFIDVLSLLASPDGPWDGETFDAMIAQRLRVRRPD